MAVPASGELKLWDTLWNQELAGTKGENSLHSASVYAGFSTPDALSDFYGWSDVEVPSVTTNSITSATNTSMVLNGNVTNTGNEAVTRGFYHGTNSSNHTANPKYSLGGTQPATGPFSCTRGGLTPQTTYYAWAFACNSAGEAVGGRVQKSTPAPPFTPTLVDFGTQQRGNVPAQNASSVQAYINPYTSGAVTLGSLSTRGWTCAQGNMVCAATNACNRSTHSTNYAATRANAIEQMLGSPQGFNNRAHSIQTNQQNPGNPQNSWFTNTNMKCNYFFGNNPQATNSFGTLMFCWCQGSDIRLKTNISYL